MVLGMLPVHYQSMSFIQVLRHPHLRAKRENIAPKEGLS